MKGCICLDIDGTITADPYTIPEKVVTFLRRLYLDGWQFLFVTGRTFTFAAKTLCEIDFPYFFAVQNGADLLLMPEVKCLSQEYLLAEVIPKIEEVEKNFREGFLIYAGWQKGDFCYYNPSAFSSDMLGHIEKIRALSSAPWKEQNVFEFSLEDSFPLLKSLGTKEDMFLLNQKLKKMTDIEATFIKDPLGHDVYLNLITAPKATKGDIVRKVRSYFPSGAVFIGAGDDYNDISLLKEVDIAIAMETSPKELLALGDIIARSARQEGIFEALLEAVGRI